MNRTARGESSARSSGVIDRPGNAGSPPKITPLGKTGYGTVPALGECPHGVGQQPSAAQLYATFGAFGARPNQLPEVQGRTCRAGAHKLICLEIYSHKVFYGT